MKLGFLTWGANRKLESSQPQVAELQFLAVFFTNMETEAWHLPGRESLLKIILVALLEMQDAVFLESDPFYGLNFNISQACCFNFDHLF